MAPIKTWAWSLPDPPPPTATYEEKSRKRQSRSQKPSTDGSEVSVGLTALPGQQEIKSIERDRSAVTNGHRSNSLALDGIRYTLFRGRKKGRALSTTTAVMSTESPSLHKSRPSLPEGNPLVLQQDRFENENEYYHHLKKMSISWPVEVHTVTRPSKKRPPPLHAIDDHTTREHIVTSSSPQAKKHLHLQGIQVGYSVETTAVKLPTLSGFPRPPSSARNISPGPVSPNPCEGDAETTFDGECNTGFLSDHAIQDFPTPPPLQLVKHARGKSSLSSTGPRSSTQDTRLEPTSFEIPSPSVNTTFRNRAPSASSARSKVTIPLVPVLEEDPVPLLHDAPLGTGVIDRTKLPLPPLPSPELKTRQSIGRLTRGGTDIADSQPHSRSSSRKDARNMSLTSNSSLNSLPVPLATAACLNMLEPSTRTSGGIAEARKISGKTRLKTTSLLSGTSWEDDVDFCYEQEAESTCNFDWQSNNTDRSLLHLLATDSQAAKSLSDAWIMTSSISPGLYSPSLSESSSSIRRSISGGAHRRRGSSVGYRAFRVRRKDHGDIPSPNVIKPLVPRGQRTPTSASQGSSSAMKTEDLEQAPNFNTLPGTLHTTDLSAQIDYLSDPESCDWKRRISSSYGSCRSSLRRSQTEPAGDTTRWSFTSASSVPDLLRSEPKTEAPLHKQLSFCNLLDAHPHSAAAGTEEVEIPSRSHTPSSERHFMRRPQTPSDRAILQNAGRAVQRGRIDRSSRSAPTVPTRSSPETTRPLSPPEVPPKNVLRQYNLENWI